MGGLRPHKSLEDREDEEAPEALLISAFLEEGEFSLAKHHVDHEDIEAWRKLWDFCVDYQHKAGGAPPLSLVKQRYPDFVLTKDVNTAWAVDQVLMASASRRIRHAMAAGAMALHEGDVGEAYDAISSVERPRAFAKEPKSIFDHALLEDTFDLGHIEVPWPTLQHLTKGGIGVGELWYIAARFKNRKTYSLSRMAARAATVGCRVGFASLEMPAGMIASRVLAELAGRDEQLLSALRSDDVFERKRAQDKLLERTPGTVSVFDPSDGPVSSTEHIRSMCADFDVVFVDHVGLMRTKDGKRAIEDWRLQATISNVLREITLETTTSVVAAAQINREGENAGSARAPKASHLAGSDALGQDADVVVTQKNLSKRVGVMSADKVRNGPEGNWYVRFEPDKGRHEEIAHDTALELMDQDGDL